MGEVDEATFSGLAERHRRELHVHCYRMLGSFEDAEDTVQETFLRAWRRRETFEGRSTFRAWLYRIATNACLDLLAKCGPEPAAGGEVPWLQPYPDRLLDELPAGGAAADDRRPAHHRRSDHGDHHLPRRPVPAAGTAGAPAGGRHGVARPAAHNRTVGKPLAARSIVLSDPGAGGPGVLMRHAVADLEASPVDGERHVRMAHLRLTDEQFAVLGARLHALADEYRELSDPSLPDASLVFALFHPAMGERADGDAQ
nr:sigma-70 family RNA polymerase sigma factor [Amycolatopsis deserti]